MKALSLAFLLLTLSLAVFAEEESSAPVQEELKDQPSIVCVAAPCNVADADKDAKKASREEFKAEREALRAKFKALRDERKAAMEAARALEGEARRAAIKAAIEKFKAGLVALREERKALREKYHSGAANKADEALAQNAKKNEEATQEVLAAGEEAPAEPVAVAEAEAPVSIKDRIPASEKNRKFERPQGSTVSAQ